MSPRVAAFALVLVLCAGAACSGYGVEFVLRGVSPPANTATPSGDLETALRVADDVADTYRMRPQLDFRNDSPVVLPDESRLLLEFTTTPAKGHANEGERSRIVLAVSASRDGSELRFVLQDADRGSESGHFARMRSDLARALAEAFPGRSIDLESGRVARGLP